MLVVVTDFSTRLVPEEIAVAAGVKGPGRQHWRVTRRIMQWAEWMDRCEGLR
jgi:predicted urease superfamily metal-dependent hydrolase